MSTYFCILTSLGAAKMANATALGEVVEFSQMALGDGGGSLPAPDQSQTSLINEVRRAALNSVKIDPDNPTWIVCEQVIPADVGGWTVRETGIYDTDGDLVAVGNFPETYKPVLEEGSGRTQTIRMVIQVSNTATVTVKIDPSVVLATREYADQSSNECLEAAKSYSEDAGNLKKGIVPDTRLPRASDADSILGINSGLLSSEQLKAAMSQFGFFGAEKICDQNQSWNSAPYGFSVLYGGAEGAPSTVVGRGFHVLTLYKSDLYIAQYAVDDSSGEEFFRLKTNSVWGGWSSNWSSRNLEKSSADSVKLGVSDSGFITPLSLESAFSKDFSDFDYIRLPGGLIVQWGYASSVSAGAGVTVMFPITFPNNAVSMLVTTEYSNSTSNVTTDSGGFRDLTNSSAIILNAGGGNTKKRWLAVGF